MRPVKMLMLVLVATFGLSSLAVACPMHGGKIVKINDATKQIVVEKGTDRAAFRVDPSDTKVTLDGKQAAFTDLKVGDVINVNYDMNEEMTRIQATRGS